MTISMTSLFLRHFLVLLGLTLGSAAPLWAAQTFYVGLNGNDSASGLSQNAPFLTVQHAADVVGAGDTVLVLPGVYHERVVIRRGGRQDAPITFRALQNGTATLNGAWRDMEAGRVPWKPVEAGIFVAEMPWQAYWVTAGPGDGVRDRCLVQYESLDGLRAWKLYGKDAPREGFYYDFANKRLYLHLRDGADPRAQTVRVNTKVGTPRWTLSTMPNDGANIRITGGASYVVVDGFRLILGETAGVLLEDAPHATVRNCFINGSMYGVFAPEGDSSHALIERVCYHNFPQHTWVAQDGRERAWRGIYRWHAGLAPDGSGLMVDRACRQLASGLRLQTDHFTVRDCHLSECFDGMSFATWHPRSGWNSEVHNNLIEGCADDGVEFDCHGINLRFHHNRINGCYIIFSFAPVITGPLFVYRNVSYSGPQDGNGTLLKFGNYPPTGRLAGLRLFHNTLISDSTVGTSWWAGEGEKYADMLAANNILMMNRTSRSWYFGAPEAARRNLIVAREHRNGESAVKPAGSTNFLAPAPLLKDPSGGDFTPLENSPALDAGVFLEGFSTGFFGAAPDVGAIERGGEVEVFGPRALTELVPIAPRL